MLPIAHWDLTGLDSSGNTDTGIPSSSVTIPALSNIQRVIFHMCVGGIQDSKESHDYQSIAGLYLQLTFWIRTVQHGLHKLHESQNAIPASLAALFDNSLGLPGTQTRYFYALYNAGDRELGQDLKVSYGGPTEVEDMTIKCDLGVFQNGINHGPAFPIKYAYSFRVLSYQAI